MEDIVTFVICPVARAHVDHTAACADQKLVCTTALPTYLLAHYNILQPHHLMAAKIYFYSIQYLFQEAESQFIWFFRPP